ncbi:hypothetical protein [Polymorphobacter megasporae]|uniref:hypothetical protein n=1 Tax=Glacieibacterium megasporae TaxID=2835787 RepID=UPI001C1E2E59|nr:hypothetical protein [Polymorphobacter megasporae]UAJ11839.1 hypothetical protein KTC28_09370 [Polymorphobacter megasporae]
MASSTSSDTGAPDSGSEPTPSGARRARSDGWTAERQLAFIEVLARGGNVGAAAASVGISVTSAYRLRARSDGAAFRFGWKAAQEMAYFKLRDIALGRIETGVEAAIAYHGNAVGSRTVYSDKLLIALLNHLRPAPEAVDKAGLRRAPADPENAYALALGAYADAIETGRAPVAPKPDDGFVDPFVEPPELMTREEFLAAIAPRPGEREAKWRAECEALPGWECKTTMRFA